jgi:hypothetical protein
MNKSIRLLLIVFTGIALLAAFNISTLHKHLMDISHQDSRNKEITIIAHYQYFVNPNSIVFDVWDVGNASHADILRNLFQLAGKLKDKKYEKIILSYRGSNRFILDGEHFNKIGREHNLQNPIYVIRTLPEHITNLKGEPAFEKWTGGIFAVLGKQMENVNEMAKLWFK